jgi:hypothetical protein
MENSETDRELFDLIKKTLDNYEELYILGSWENFIKKRKRRKKLILWFTVTGIAASLLLGWFGYRFIFPGSISNKNVFNQQVISNLTTPTIKDTLKDQIHIRQAPVIQAKDNNKYRISHNQGLQPKSEPLNKIQTTKQIRDTTDILSIAEVNASELNPIINLSEKTITNQTPDTVNTSLQLQDVSVEDVRYLSALNKSDSSINNPDYKKEEIIATPEKNLSDKRRSQKIRIGVNISPGITSTNTGSSFNYSGGINADFDFSSSLRFSTGIQIERQNVINKNSDNPAWIPPGNTQSELVDLDVPLNITWKFLIKKSTCYYLSSGISSVVYLSEKYTNTSYTQKMVQATEMVDGVPNLVYQLENVKSVEQTTEAPLSTFDFAGRINITLGIQQPLSSKLFLHFEPFIKIPVSDLATQNLRFTTSGIMCKISF